MYSVAYQNGDRNDQKSMRIQKLSQARFHEPGYEEV